MTKETRTVSLDEENDEFLANHDNASALVNDLVEQYRKTGNRGTTALELQKKQKERELEEQEARTDRLRQDVSELDAMIREFQREEDAELQEAKDALAETPRDAENPAIETWARDLGMTPSELLSELPPHTE